jgi:C4-dicarboxylate-specific signal transduction histidine kinase
MTLTISMRMTIFLPLSCMNINFCQICNWWGKGMDVFETSSKAIDLYAEEVKRRIEQLEKTNKEKDDTIKTHKEREHRLVVWLAVLVAALFAIVFFLMMNAMYLTSTPPALAPKTNKKI